MIVKNTEIAHSFVLIYQIGPSIFIPTHPLQGTRSVCSVGPPWNNRAPLFNTDIGRPTPRAWNGVAENKQNDSLTSKRSARLLLLGIKWRIRRRTPARSCVMSSLPTAATLSGVFVLSCRADSLELRPAPSSVDEWRLQSVLCQCRHVDRSY